MELYSEPSLLDFKSKQALLKLQQYNIPHVFVTNGSGKTENERIAQVNLLLNNDDEKGRSSKCYSTNDVVLACPLSSTCSRIC